MKKKKKKHIGRTIFLILLALVLIGIICGFLALKYIKAYNKAFIPGSEEKIEFEVTKGSGTSTIAYKLEERGVIKSAFIFKFKTKFTGQDGTYQAGSYVLSPGMTTEEIMETLQSGICPQVSFTIPEGLTLTEVGEKLVEQGIISSMDVYIDALEDEYSYSFLPDTGIASNGLSARANRLEGYLYPETYSINEGSNAHTVISTMLKQFSKEFSSDLIAQIPSGYDINAIVTLASIIEKECGADEDRALISSVFWNRLNNGMRLESDVTILYDLPEEEEFSTQYDSPYNTYMVDGLPAGPICSPSIKSITAALNPEVSNYFYFVLIGDGSGRCNFAEDYWTHLYNVQIYRNNAYNY